MLSPIKKEEFLICIEDLKKLAERVTIDDDLRAALFDKISELEKVREHVSAATYGIQKYIDNLTDILY